MPRSFWLKVLLNYVKEDNKKERTDKILVLMYAMDYLVHYKGIPSSKYYDFLFSVRFSKHHGSVFLQIDEFNLSVNLNR